MTETARLALPLVAPSQAQKHVTVNEALTRLDGMTQLVLASVSEVTPPASPPEGTVHFVPSGAVNAWAGQEGRLALYQGGGWVFVDPGPGWRGYIADAGHLAVWTGSDWAPVGVAASPSGAGTVFRSVEIDHSVAAGASSTTTAVLPSGSLVLAITGIVTADITGGATGFQLGVAGAPDRYGTGIGVATGSWLRGVTSAPVAYYADTPLVLTAEGGSFSGGSVRLVAHLAEFSLPSAT
ncbi:MAG: DUF2793 domain-containing protein [Paracoccaceae bacterium]|nr:DUF2793 domain-containing protein [Paracoccaceae bacterium]